MADERSRRYLFRLRVRIRQNRRSRCRACGARERLELAHRRPTGLNGMGRGRKERYLDVRRNPRAYVLLCRRCHRLYDMKLLRPAHPRGGWRCVLIGPGDYDLRAKVGEAAQDWTPSHLPPPQTEPIP